MLDALAWFFTPEPVLLSQGNGFSLFSGAHLVVLAVCLIVSALLVVRYRGLPKGVEWGSRRRHQLLAMAIVPLAFLLSRNIQLIALGLYANIFWPLHICNFSEYLSLAYALHPQGRGGRHLGNLLFCWGLSGGIGALLFPGWSYCPILSYVSVSGFVEHTLLMTIVLCVLAGHDLAPDIKGFWLPGVCAIGGGLFFRWFNSIFDTNFFFVTRPGDAGAPFAFVAGIFGNPGYLVPYFLIVVGVWFLMYGIWWLASGRHLARGTSQRG